MCVRERSAFMQSSVASRLPQTRDFPMFHEHHLSLPSSRRRLCEKQVAGGRDAAAAGAAAGASISRRRAVRGAAAGGIAAGEYVFETSHHELQSLAKLKRHAQKGFFGKVRYTKLSSFVYAGGGDEDGRPVIALKHLGDGDIIRCVRTRRGVGEGGRPPAALCAARRALTPCPPSRAPALQVYKAAYFGMGGGYGGW